MVAKRESVREGPRTLVSSHRRMKAKRISHGSTTGSPSREISTDAIPFSFSVQGCSFGRAIAVRSCVKTAPRTMHSPMLPVKFLLAFLRAFLWSNPSIYVKCEPLSRSLSSRISSEAIDYVVTPGLFIGRYKRRRKKENVRNISAETLLHQVSLYLLYCKI